MLRNWGPCPQAPPLLPVPSHGLVQPSPQSFLQTPGNSCSQNGHLLAHLSVPRRTCIQTGVPARGWGSQSKGDTAQTHRTQTRGAEHLQGRQMGREPRRGHTACSSLVLLAVFVGEGEESGTWPETAFQKAAESKRDLQEKETRGQWSQAQGRMGEPLQAGMKRNPTK